MSTFLELPERIPNESLEAVATALRELDHAHREFHRFVEHSSESLETILGQFSDLEVELRDADDQLAGREREHAERSADFSRQQACVQEQTEQIQRLTQDLASARRDQEHATQRLAQTFAEKERSERTLAEVTEEMDALTQLVDLVKSTHDQWVGSHRESSDQKQNLRAELEGIYQAELESLRQEKLQLEKQLADAEGALRLSQIETRHEHEALDQLQSNWSHELERVRQLLDARLHLLHPAVPRDRRGTTADLPSSVPSSVPNEATSQAKDKVSVPSPVSAKDEPRKSGADEEPDHDPDLPEQDTGESAPHDPVVGSVLAEFSRLSTPGT